MNKTRLCGAVLAGILWVVLQIPEARAYFCGDPLSDNCFVPKVQKPSTPNADGSVRTENHPTAVFVLQSGKTLKENFEAWGASSGWKVVWKSEYTFPVVARYTAGRSFLGSVRRAIRIFNRSAGGWLRARAFMTNHVLIVEDGR
jgi:epoxyqueuosine reductase QueG